ncbi:complement component 4 binding protein, GPI-anchored isoform X1 [Gallus gallus]|uniref:complement component 4 binding protein, GPI-anchored isoform X1 n=1 Tax=Gallus gallus TaxID=9031 RepID=UPI001F02C4D6|nr:complement component 4 binding protein, GPI-anchored isoform X1 [Gallus gallus]XP_046788903.1 complement component 4 binding protein, GPI-anchored isoform X1 [Gallus gallus]
MRRRNESVLLRERRKGLMQPPIAPEKVVRRRAAQSRAVPLGCSQHRAQPPERPEMAVGTALLWLSAALLALPGVCGDCPQPPRFAFAEPPGPTNSSYPVGTVLRYRCRPGYTGDRNKLPSVTCLPNSTWASDPDFCIGKSCGQPEIPNGNFHFSTNLQFGATINFTCKAGYRLVGKPTAQCILSGSDVVWDAVPYCEIIPCQPPPPIENGTLSSVHGEYTFGVAVTYSCKKGLSLIGNATIHCTMDDNLNGIWSGPAPECKDVRCEKPEVENAKNLNSFATEYTYGEKVSFECAPGHALSGAQTVTCDADNTWKPSLPSCDPRQQCTAPTIPNGIVNGDSFLFGTTVTFSCNAEYELKGSSSAKCVAVESGVEWDVKLPSCERQRSDVLCEQPPSIGNGVHNGTGGTAFPLGSVVVYSCNDGFNLVGDRAIQCLAKTQDRGVWSTPTPECRGGASSIIVGILPLLLAMLVMNF